MAGMKFLNLKGWHPSNARNQKRIWIAEQQAAQKAQAERDAAAEVRKQAETQHLQALAAAKGDVESARQSEQMQVGFLYAPPPGLAKVDENAAQEMTEDDAVREFRRKMEKRSGISTEDLQRPLERYVGRRPDEMLTIKEQVERFPFLKDAPVEGDYASNVKVNFKPMGRTLRNVKCMRCGEWGHQSGDRECTMRDVNPHDAARQAREDPMAIMAQLKKQGQLVLKQRALPLEMQTTEGQDKSEYEILLSDEEAADPEQAFLASLSTKEKKALLKKLRKQSKEDRNNSDNDRCSSEDSRGDRSSKKRRRKHKTRSHEEKKHCHRDHHRDDSDRDTPLRSDEKKRRSRRDRESRSRSRSRTRGSESRHHRREDGHRRRSRSRSRGRHRRP